MRIEINAEIKNGWELGSSRDGQWTASREWLIHNTLVQGGVTVDKAVVVDGILMAADNAMEVLTDHGQRTQDGHRVLWDEKGSPVLVNKAYDVLVGSMGLKYYNRHAGIMTNGERSIVVRVMQK